jgi:hypothetical protein
MQVALLILAIAAVVGLWSLVRIQESRQACDRYKVALQAALANPTSNQPITGLTPANRVSIEESRSVYQEQDLALEGPDPTISMAGGGTAHIGHSEVAGQRGRNEAAWTAYADSTEKLALAKRNCS